MGSEVGIALASASATGGVCALITCTSRQHAKQAFGGACGALGLGARAICSPQVTDWCVRVDLIQADPPQPIVPAPDRCTEQRRIRDERLLSFHPQNFGGRCALSSSPGKNDYSDAGAVHVVAGHRPFSDPNSLAMSPILQGRRVGSGRRIAAHALAAVYNELTARVLAGSCI